MVFPLAAIFRTSLWDENGFSLSRYVEVFTNQKFLKAIWNTLIISTWVGAISVVVDGQIERGLNSEQLRARLRGLLLQRGAANPRASEVQYS